jgi:hypothetical protein
MPGVTQVQSLKFVIVQSSGAGREEKLLDADYKILPGAGSEGRESSTPRE